MDDKSPQKTNEQTRHHHEVHADENGAVAVIGHIRIRDRDTGKVLLDQRDIAPPTVLPLNEEGDTE